jgi:hypothetical protein
LVSGAPEFLPHLIVHSVGENCVNPAIGDLVGFWLHKNKTVVQILASTAFLAKLFATKVQPNPIWPGFAL